MTIQNNNRAIRPFANYGRLEAQRERMMRDADLKSMPSGRGASMASPSGAGNMLPANRFASPYQGPSKISMEERLINKGEQHLETGKICIAAAQAMREVKNRSVVDNRGADAHVVSHDDHITKPMYNDFTHSVNFNSGYRGDNADHYKAAYKYRNQHH